MKYLYLLLLISALFLQSCSTDNSVSPETDQAGNTTKTWINTSETATLLKTVTVVNPVNGITGGLVKYDLKIGSQFVSGSLYVPENAFEGELDITTEFSSQSTTQSFGPSPLSFNKSLILDLEYKGVNLKDINPDEVDFYFIDNNGNLYKAQYKSIYVNIEEGVLRVSGAVIDHFSRYGWAK